MPKVLVVDDSLSVRKVVEKALQARRLEVVSAASAAEAIDRIEHDHPDVIVCDVVLPDREGYEICQYVRTHPAARRTPVLLISGVASSRVLARAAEVESDDVLFKPFAAEDLVRRIDGLLAGPGPRANGSGGGPDRSADASPPAGSVAGPAVAVPPALGPGPEPVLAADLSEQLGSLVRAWGVRAVVLADREGFLIGAAGDRQLDADTAAALAAWIGEGAEGAGRELGQTGLTGLVVEYREALFLVHLVGGRALLAVLFDDFSGLGKVRYGVRRALPELERVLS